jgi:hypothetical protein
MKRLVLLLALLSSAAYAETVLLDCGDGVLLRYQSSFLGINDPTYVVRREQQWEPICSPGIQGNGQLAYREECSAFGKLLVRKTYERGNSGEFDWLRSSWVYDFNLYRISMTIRHRTTNIDCKRLNRG